MRVSFLDFARTGAFASVRLGASRAEVVAELEEPDDVGHPRRKAARLLLYVGIEFHFADDVCSLSTLTTSIAPYQTADSIWISVSKSDS